MQESSSVWSRFPKLTKFDRIFCYLIAAVTLYLVSYLVYNYLAYGVVKISRTTWGVRQFHPYRFYIFLAGTLVFTLSALFLVVMALKSPRYGEDE
ncbi:hypothetical protein AB6806_10960 [Bosea sp. RCC_152_1]|uniref:hypothetical protein n=1 Tax=Bosea sp. RCC_152_1 TaxID=3239228 RepID=UPI003525B0F3